MRILERYILLKILGIFLSTIFIFTFLYVLIDVTSNLEKYIDRDVSFDILLQYYTAFFPMILTQTSAIACLLGVLLTFSSLNNHNEVIVMRASGLNFWQITKPALMFGLIISMMVFYMNERFVPDSHAMTRQIKNESIILKEDSRRKKKESVRNLTFYGLKNRLYYVDTFDPNNDHLQGITIIEYGENTSIRQKIVAFEGNWTGIAWKFFNVQITEYNQGGISQPIVRVYKEKLMDIKETPEDFYRQRIKVESMNLIELNEYISRFSQSGASTAINNLKVDLHHKVSFPFGNLVVVLTGLPFALMVKSRKGMTFSTVGIAIAVAFLYYVASAVSLAFGKGGWLPPLASAWAAPLFFTFVAVTVIETYFSST